MEYYVALAGEKVGPLTQFRLVEMLREGEVSADDKAWHKDLDGWMRLSEIPSMKSVVESITEKEAEKKAAENSPPAVPTPKDQPSPPKKVPVAFEVRPLTRFWARLFDYLVVIFLAIWFSDVEVPKLSPEPLTLVEGFYRSKEIFRSEEYQQFNQLVIYSILIWHVLEAVFISLLGTTPGKALFGIHILTYSGQRPAILPALGRSFLVFVLGMGMHIPLLVILAMTFTFFRLMTRGQTLWDQALRLQVRHPPMSIGRILLAILAFFALMMLQFVKI